MIRILLKANKETNLLNIQGKSDRGSINEDIEKTIVERRWFFEAFAIA